MSYEKEEWSWDISTGLNTGADWEQSKRLLIHWHNMWEKV